MKWIADATTRYEREANERHVRAQEHLERVRTRRGMPPIKRSRWLATLGISALLGAFWGNALLAPRPDTLAVRGAARVAPTELAAAIGFVPGATPDRIELGALVDQLEDHDWIADAGAVQLPTGTLLVRIEERTPLAWIESGSPPQAFAVDASGTPFAPAETEELRALPKLVAAGSVTPRLPSERLAEAIRVAYGLTARGLALPTRVSIAADSDPEGFILELPRLAARIVVGREHLDERLDDLARVVAEQADLLAESSNLDLRFAQHLVLRQTPTPTGSDNAAARGRAQPQEKRPAG